jgi:hypothetical protein
MAVGLSPVNLANKWLDMLAGTAFSSAPANVFVKLHLGDPGSAGAGSPSLVTTRQQVTWSAASGGSKASASIPAFSMTNTERITHISLWDTNGTPTGNFLASAQLTNFRDVVSGDSLTVTVTVAFTPMAA